MAEMTEKKPNPFVNMWGATVRFFKEIKSETKKIIWPTRKDIYNGTVITVSAIFIIGVFIWLLTLILKTGIDRIVGI